MRPFVVNGHGRLVFPSNFSADLDFSVLETLERGIAHTLEPALQEADRG